MSEIKPAIAAEDWPQRLEDVRRYGFSEMWENFHDAAALALHGQPFGFTWADVDALRWHADNIVSGAAREALLSIAARIAALLAPR